MLHAACRDLLPWNSAWTLAVHLESGDHEGEKRVRLITASKQMLAAEIASEGEKAFL